MKNLIFHLLSDGSSWLSCLVRKGLFEWSSLRWLSSSCFSLNIFGQESQANGVRESSSVFLSWLLLICVSHFSLQQNFNLHIWQLCKPLWTFLLCSWRALTPWKVMLHSLQSLDLWYSLRCSSKLLVTFNPQIWQSLELFLWLLRMWTLRLFWLKNILLQFLYGHG